MAEPALKFSSINGDDYVGTVGSLPWKQQSLSILHTSLEQSLLATAKPWLIQAF